MYFNQPVSSGCLKIFSKRYEADCLPIFGDEHDSL